MNDTFVSVLHLFTKVNSECRQLLYIQVEKNLKFGKRSWMELLGKIVKIFKNTNYFSNNIYLRHLTGFKYTSEEYSFWKYPEI